MPIAGSISPKARRCLENMLVSGPVTALELNALDPTAPDHRQTIKALKQSKYVVNGPKPANGSQCTYILTRKAKQVLGATVADTDPVGAAQPERAPRATRRHRPTHHSGTSVAGPVRICAMSTAGHYHPGKDMLAPPARIGAEDALAMPSRVGDWLHYRDGRVTPINPSTTKKPRIEPTTLASISIAALPAIGADLDGGAFFGVITGKNQIHYAATLLPAKSDEGSVVAVRRLIA